MGIPIARNFVERLIRDRWDTVDELQSGWNERVQIQIQKVGIGRNRATVYRWLAGGLPNQPHDIFGLAAALGVDPIVLLDIESGSFQRILKLEWIFFLANMKGRGRMSALWPLVRPAAHWPNMAISHDYYSCRWTTVEFSHDAEAIQNVYARLRLRIEPSEDEATSHRVYYVAYRRRGARDGFWRPYGIVRKRGKFAICVGHNGDMMNDAQDLPRQIEVDESGALDVETFFGPGPCEFKIACLHPFTLEFEVPSRAQNALRFSG